MPWKFVQEEEQRLDLVRNCCHAQMCHLEYLLTLLAPISNKPGDKVLDDQKAIRQLARYWHSEKTEQECEDFLANVRALLDPERNATALRDLHALSRDEAAIIKSDILHTIIDGPIDADKYDYTHHAARRESSAELYRLLSHALALEAHEDRVSFLKKHRAMRQAFTEALSEKLGINFGFGDALLDIPEPEKDQVKNLFVCMRGRKDQSSVEIQAVTPLANAVAESFVLWTRKVRVFLSDNAWAAIRQKAITPEKVFEACEGALRTLDPQHHLEFQAEREEPKS